MCPMRQNHTEGCMGGSCISCLPSLMPAVLRSIAVACSTPGAGEVACEVGCGVPCIGAVLCGYSALGPPVAGTEGLSIGACCDAI